MQVGFGERERGGEGSCAMKDPDKTVKAEGGRQNFNKEISK